MRQEAADAVQHAQQIDVDHPAPIVEREGLDAAGGRDAGIVADHMDVAECIECRLRRARDAVGIGDIAGDAAHIRRDLAQAFDGRIKRAGLDIGQQHLHAGRSKRAAEREADAGGAARNESRPAAEVAHAPPPPCRPHLIGVSGASCITAQGSKACP